MSHSSINQKLQQSLSYLSVNSKFYKKLFHDQGIDISTIHSVDLLRHLPTVSKADLQSYNRDFFCVPDDQFADIVTTSGTSGIPVMVPMTRNDLERLAINEQNSFEIAGVSNKDLVQLTVTMDKLFMAGLAYFSGVQRLGATSLRIGPGSPKLQLQHILNFKPTVLVGVPSFIAKIAEYAVDNDIDMNDTSVKKIICIGDAIRDKEYLLNSIGNRITEKWKVDLYSTYASTEMATAFTECRAQQGGHIQEDLLIVEILDEKGNNVKDGTPGEVTITTLGIEAMPLLRFRTGDVAFIDRNKCSCGRKTPRIGPILGRKDQMIKYKGTTFYPAAIVDVLNNFPKIINFYIEVSSELQLIDNIKIIIGSNEINNTELKEIRENFKTNLRVIPDIIIEPIENVLNKTRKDQNRKPKIFFDERK